MLVDQNIENIQQIAEISRRLGADEIQLDTPLRPSAVKPLERQRVQWAKKFFEDMPVVSVFDAPLQEYTPMDEKATMKRHGNYRKTQFCLDLFRKIKEILKKSLTSAFCKTTICSITSINKAYI